MCMICRKDFQNKPKWSQKGDNTLSPIVLKSENLIKIHSIEKGEPAAAQLIQPSLLNWMLTNAQDCVRHNCEAFPEKVSLSVPNTNWLREHNKLIESLINHFDIGPPPSKATHFLWPKDFGSCWWSWGDCWEAAPVLRRQACNVFPSLARLCKGMYKRCMYHQRVLGQSDFSFIFSFVKLWPSCHSEKNLIVYFELLLYFVFLLLILDF